MKKTANPTRSRKNPLLLSLLGASANKLMKFPTQMIQMKKSRLLLPLATLAGFAVATGSSHAAVIANFTDGNGTSSVDQYQGIVGNGWTTAWQFQGATFSSTVVTNTTPVNSGGNYLSTSKTSNVVPGLAAVGRRFATTVAGGGVDNTLPVVFSFDLRIDTLTGWDATSDAITLNANNASGTTYGASGNSSWIIRAYGATSGGATASQWAFYNGAADGGGFSSANFVSSGMTVSAGTTYSFTIVSDPDTKKYVTTISNGTTTVTSASMGWRATSASDGIGFSSEISATDDNVSWSLDSVSIANIPEPSTALLGGLGLLALLRRRR
jgi:hypothetical protein